MNKRRRHKAKARRAHAKRFLETCEAINRSLGIASARMRLGWPGRGAQTVKVRIK